MEGRRNAGQKPIYLEPESEKPFSLSPFMCTNHAPSGHQFPLTPTFMLQGINIIIYFMLIPLPPMSAAQLQAN
jgi:hypothetical protein